MFVNIVFHSYRDQEIALFFHLGYSVRFDVVPIAPLIFVAEVIAHAGTYKKRAFQVGDVNNVESLIPA